MVSSQIVDFRSRTPTIITSYCTSLNLMIYDGKLIRVMRTDLSVVAMNI